MIKLNQLQSKFIGLFLDYLRPMIFFKILNKFQRESNNYQLIGYDFAQVAFIDFLYQFCNN